MCVRSWLPAPPVEALTVWGTGTPMRDFIHIEDCVGGVMTTIDQIDDGGAVNLSTGILTSLSILRNSLLAPNSAFQPRNSVIESSS